MHFSLDFSTLFILKEFLQPPLRKIWAGKFDLFCKFYFNLVRWGPKCLPCNACLCTIFKKAGMKAGVLSLPLAFSYLTLLKWRACDLNLVIFNSTWILDAHLSAVLLREIEKLYPYQIWITSSSYQKNQIAKSLREWQHLPPSWPLEHGYFAS